MSEFFRRFSHVTAEIVGSPPAFLVAFAIIVVWAVTGPVFHFSDTWQLVINTGTTIVTFLMVFLIQASQNRDAKAVHLKLDEIIRAIAEARNSVIDLEDLPDKELKRLQVEFQRLNELDRAGMTEDDLADVSKELAERGLLGEFPGGGGRGGA